MAKKYIADNIDLASDLSMVSTSSGEQKIVMGNTDGSQTTNDYSRLYLTGKSTSTSSTTGAEVVLTTGGSGLARVRFDTDYNFGSTNTYRTANVGYSGGSNAQFYISHGPPTGARNTITLDGDNTYFNYPLRIGDNSSTNELDDYEEGSYNVEFRVNGVDYGSSNWVSGGGTVWTDNSQYVKVGRKVSLFFDLEYKGIPSAISTYTGALQLTNLPFTMAHGGGGNIGFSWYNRNTTTSSNPQDLGGATRLTPSGSNTSSLINLERLDYSSYWGAWFISTMQTNYLPTAPPGGNVRLYGQFTYFTDN
jgi:hypothetical protein